METSILPFWKFMLIAFSITTFIIGGALIAFNITKQKEENSKIEVIDKSLPLNELLIVIEKRIMFQELELHTKNSKIKLQMQDSVKKYTKLLVGKDSVNYNWDDMYPPIEK